jgi:hypothetical protein
VSSPTSDGCPGWRVATVSVTLLVPDEGATGPSQLVTGDDRTMRRTNPGNRDSPGAIILNCCPMRSSSDSGTCPASPADRLKFLRNRMAEDVPVTGCPPRQCHKSTTVQTHQVRLSRLKSSSVCAPEPLKSPKSPQSKWPKKQEKSCTEMCSFSISQPLRPAESCP